MKFLLKLLLSAFAVVAILPVIHGISFHGNFLGAVLIALFFGVMLWVVDFIAIAISTLLTISSFGVALLWLIPLWLLGFWLLPAVALKLVSDFFPAYLSISGWMPAIFGGLVMMLVAIVSSDLFDRPARTGTP
jgi:hypothetical protein